MLNFFAKTLLKSKLKSAGVPESEMNKLLEMVEKNPDFFKEIAVAAQEKMKSGLSQQDAVMAVLQDKQEELKKVMGK
jgi:hypothetical protein